MFSVGDANGLQGTTDENQLTPLNGKYQQLMQNIDACLRSGQQTAVRQVNRTLVETYWHIGRYIVEFEQQGQQKADYGSELLKRLAKDLKAKYKKGFSRSHLQYMRLFYLHYPNCQTLSGKLSWSHYIELLSISDNLARSFYEQQCIKENWSVRELKRQRDSALFERLALSKDKQEILDLATQGQTLLEAKDIVKDPYILEFLELPERNYRESELEQQLLIRVILQGKNTYCKSSLATAHS